MNVESTINDSVLLMTAVLFAVIAYRQKVFNLRAKLLPSLMVISVNALLLMHSLLSLKDTDYTE